MKAKGLVNFPRMFTSYGKTKKPYGKTKKPYDKENVKCQRNKMPEGGLLPLTSPLEGVGYINILKKTHQLGSLILHTGHQSSASRLTSQDQPSAWHWRKWSS